MMSVVIRGNVALREAKGDDELVDVAHELAEQRLDVREHEEREDAEAGVLLAIRLSKHASPLVRAAVCQALAAFRPRVCADRLIDLSTNDKSNAVRKAAQSAMEADPVGCLSCIECGDEAKVAPDDAGDPQDMAPMFPMFCSIQCAATYGLDAARRELNSGLRHVCINDSWGAGDQAECHDCEMLATLGMCAE